MSDAGFEREDAEIARYYDSIKAADVFGVWGTLLLMRLPLGMVNKFMRPGQKWDEETWARTRAKKDRETIIAEMEEYFQDAVEIVIRHRGISASRTLHYYMAWAWLINDMELFAYFMDQRNYPNYGAPMLYGYAQKYDQLDMLPDDPMKAEMFRRMSLGQKCSELCPGKCGGGTPKTLRPRLEIIAATQPSPGLILPK